MTPTSIVAYLTLFAAAGCLFILASLLLGSLLRRQAPSPMKLEAYECGEPAVGSTAVRFDLRFYVVALVFIIFEVEVALFFPPATIFGKATQLMNPHVAENLAVKLQGQLGMWETIPAPFYKLVKPRNASERRAIAELQREAARHMSYAAGRARRRPTPGCWPWRRWPTSARSSPSSSWDSPMSGVAAISIGSGRWAIAARPRVPPPA